MKRILISFLFVLLSFSFLVAQTAANLTDAKGKKQGLWEEKSPAGRSIGTYVDDQKDGCWTSYASDGKLIRIESFKKGLRDGIAVDIDQRGYLVSEMFYVNNLLEGTAKKYYYGTSPASYIDYLHGKINGKKKLYYENSLGKMMEESDYKNDLKNGSSRFFSISGDTIAEYNYADNMLQGIQKTYYPKKKIMSEQQFKDNLENGNSKEYYENGKLKTEGTFANGLMTGTWKEYDENGVIKTQGNYVNGLKEGKWQEFDATGKVVETIIYSKGQVK
jgi:antitoxin component YwqK of YwqJK toxin-antitoxin module